MLQSISHRITARFLALTAVAVLLGGVATDCSGEGGMYQGGGDSAPGWR
jgi:hypothetical protein